MEHKLASGSISDSRYSELLFEVTGTLKSTPSGLPFDTVMQRVLDLHPQFMPHSFYLLVLFIYLELFVQVFFN